MEKSTIYAALVMNDIANTDSAHGSVADLWDEILEFVLAEIDNLPPEWNNYEGNWRNGYNQCRNRVARLLENSRRR